MPEADVGSILVNVDGRGREDAGGVRGAAGAVPAAAVLGRVFLSAAPEAGFSWRRTTSWRRRWRCGGRSRRSWWTISPCARSRHSVDPRVVLVAHGSKQTGTVGGMCAAWSHGRCRRAMAALEVGFLEEAPFASEVVARTDPPWSAIGLFLGEGLHGGEDFDVLVSTAQQAARRRPSRQANWAFRA